MSAFFVFFAFSHKVAPLPGDRFCADIETQGKELKELKGSLERQGKEVRENSTALKDITKESIGKIKEVASNCQQIEKNIRWEVGVLG